MLCARAPLKKYKILCQEKKTTKKKTQRNIAPVVGTVSAFPPPSRPLPRAMFDGICDVLWRRRFHFIVCFFFIANANCDQANPWENFRKERPCHSQTIWFLIFMLSLIHTFFVMHHTWESLPYYNMWAQKRCIDEQMLSATGLLCELPWLCLQVPGFAGFPDFLLQVLFLLSLGSPCLGFFFLSRKRLQSRPQTEQPFSRDSLPTLPTDTGTRNVSLILESFFKCMISLIWYCYTFLFFLCHVETPPGKPGF